MQCLLRMNVYPFRSERSFDPALLATANTVPCVSSATRKCPFTSGLPFNLQRDGCIRTRSFDRELRRGHTDQYKTSHLCCAVN